jgi:hypothetical protein
VLLALLLSGCLKLPWLGSQPKDALFLTIHDLPDDLDPDISITGPDGSNHYSPAGEHLELLLSPPSREIITRQVALKNLAAGTYTITARDAVHRPAADRPTTFSPDIHTQEARLVRGGVVRATVQYTPDREYGQAAVKRLNEYRSLAGVDPVTLDVERGTALWLHTRYLAENGVTGYSEDPRKPWYTFPGAQASRRSSLTSLAYDLSSHYRAEWDDPAWPIDALVNAPFNFLRFMSPELGKVHVATYHSPASCGDFSPCEPKERDWFISAVQGSSLVPRKAEGNVRFPEHQQTVTTLSFHQDTPHFFTEENPDPLTACPGYASPAGLPIFTMSGESSDPPAITGSQLERNGTPVDHCVFTADTYTNPDESHQSFARSILRWDGAVMLMPREPLEPNSTYTVTISTSTGVDSWEFHTDQ